MPLVSGQIKEENNPGIAMAALGLLHVGHIVSLTESAAEMIRSACELRRGFTGIWEHLNNPGFKPVEFDGFKKQTGLNSFTLTPKQWIEKTNAELCEADDLNNPTNRLCHPEELRGLLNQST